MEKLTREIILFTGVFSLLYVFSFSFPFTIIPNVGAWLEPMFNRLVLWEVQETYHSGEDSIGMMYNTLNVLVIAFLVYFGLTSFLSTELKEKAMKGVVVWIRYYLAIILLIYGFDKVYKWQFYSPESNILYTRVKDLPQDMLYWTTMGTSYSYSLFGGMLEVIAGALLLFRKTLLVGVLLSTSVLMNVFAVNVGFDITVKLFSGFLLLMSCVLLLPYIPILHDFLRGESVRLNQKHPFYTRYKFYFPMKIVILLLFLVESQYKYAISGNFNDDHFPRPHFNGVYEVIDGEAVRVHFHRHGYFIMEMNNGDFHDFRLEVLEAEQKFVLQDYSNQQFELNYQENEDTLRIFNQEGSFYIVTVKQEL